MAMSTEQRARSSARIPRRFAFALLVVAALLAGVYVARMSGDDPNSYSNDFNVFYFAAREVIAGRDPYQRSLGEWTPYLYPPLLAELITPLASLPLPVAAYVWFLASAASLMMTLALSASLCESPNKPEHDKAKPDGALRDGVVSSRNAFVTSRRMLIALGAAAMVARFALDNFALGQVNTLVTALAVGHVYLHLRGKKYQSAIALALAASVKVTPSLLIIYHLARGRVRFAAGCLALTLALMGASFVALGSRAPIAFREFVNRTLRNEQGYDLAYSGNQSMRGALERLERGSQPTARNSSDAGARNPIHLPALMVSLMLVGLAVMAARSAPGAAAAAAPFFCCLVLVSPLSWKAHFVALILPVACLIRRALDSARGLERKLTALSLLLAFVLFNLTSPSIAGLRTAEWADRHSLIFAGSLVVYVFVCLRASLSDQSA